MKKKFGKRFWINLVVIIIVGIFSGYFAGTYYVSAYMGGIKTDILPSEEVIRDKVSDVLKATKGKSVSQISATNNMILGEYYMNQRDYVKRYTYGNVKAAGVTQKLVSTKVLVDGEYFSEEVSQGMVNLATKYYHIAGSDKVELYKGSVDKSLNTDYTGVTAQQLTCEQFNNEYGVKANYFLNYIVSSNTVLSEKYCGKSRKGATKTYDKDLHVFELTLDSNYSVKNYMYKVKGTSGSSEFPQFISIKLSFMIDDEFTIHEVSYDETYRVTIAVLGKITTNGKLTDEFTYDNSFVIPR